MSEREDLDAYFAQINDTIYYSEILYTNIFVREQLCYFGKDSANMFMLSSIIGERKVLFFNYPNNACYSCIQSIITMLEANLPNYKINDDIVFISKDMEYRFKDNLEGKTVLTLSEPIIKFKDDFLGESPYFFILDKTMTVKYLHFFNKTNENRTSVYLKAVTKVLNKEIDKMIK